MPGLIDNCVELFECKDLYSVLGIPREATEKQIKKAYHKMSLKVHPDRVNDVDKDGATKKFQTLGKVYSILADKDKRALYNETGEVDDESDVDPDKDWIDYWRLLFKKVTVEDIKNFEKKYKESKEEESDLKAAYLEHEGDMDLIMEEVLCATIEDEPRFRKMLNEMIKNKEVPSYKTFVKESKAKRKARKDTAKEEAREAKKYKEELGLGDDDKALRQAIMKRQENRKKEAESFFAMLEKKYAEPEPSSSKSKKKGRKGK